MRTMQRLLKMCACVTTVDECHYSSNGRCYTVSMLFLVLSLAKGVFESSSLRFQQLKDLYRIRQNSQSFDSLREGYPFDVQAVAMCKDTAPQGGRHLVTAAAVLTLLCVGFTQGVITGDPPSFLSDDQPQDQFVFEIDDEDRPVTLTFLCPVDGTGPPNITWYRGDEVDDLRTTEDGSYVFPNITSADSEYANDVGIEYYCTATNDFGTIRSPTVRAYYAAFAGFVDGEEIGPSNPTPEVRTEDVIDGDDLQQYVALECALNESSTPPPAIEWVQVDTTSDVETVLVEDLVDNLVRFIDNKQWVILETTTNVIQDKEYFCQVTNKERFQTARGPITYVLNAVTQFNRTLYPDGVRIYKQLSDKSAPRVETGADTDGVPFGIAAAYDNDELSYAWSVNTRNSRISGSGPVVSIIPSFTATDMDPTLDVEVMLNPVGVSSTAVLTLLDPAIITASPSSMNDILTGTSWSGSCVAEGVPEPTITFYHNGIPLVGDDVVVIIEGGSLSITSTTVDHSGMYQCLAENESGSKVATWFLIFREAIPPTITSSFLVNPDPCLDYPLIIREVDTDPVILSVNITADPCPTAVWTLNGTIVTSDTPGITITDGCANYMLGDKVFIYTLSVDDFTDTTQGNYAVTFNNIAGTKSVPEVRVTEKVRAKIFDIRTEPSSPIKGTDLFCLADGMSVNIICQNYGFPVAIVEFTKDSILVDPELDDRLTLTCDTLNISSVTAEDEGTYRCRVENDDGDETEEDTSDDIIKLEHCIVPTILAEIAFTSSNPLEDHDTSITCQWQGSPDPEAIWLKDDVELVEEDLPSRIRITDTDKDGILMSELQIGDVELSDTGDYTCQVSNAVGTVMKITRLEVRERDEPVLSEIAIIGISAGGGGFIVLLAVVIVLLCCVYQCAKGQAGDYKVQSSSVALHAIPSDPISYNVDSPDGLDEEPEPFNPDYASLPAMRPAQPPQYKPTPQYPSTDMLHHAGHEDFQKLPPSDDDFVGPYGHDNGGMHPGGYGGPQPGYTHQQQQPTVDDFVSDDAQFV